MADLQAALDELKAEVAGLDKQKTDLLRDIVQLKSKKAFLKTAVDDYEKSKDSARISYDVLLEKLKANETDIEERINIAQEDLDAVLKAKLDTESELETLEQQHEQEIIGHNKRLKAVKDEVNATVALKNTAIKELNETNKQISIRRDRFRKLDETIKQAELQAIAQVDEFAQLVKTAEQRLSLTDVKVEAALTVLEDLTAQTNIKITELAKLDAKHQEFIAYENRAKSALKARESALLQGEADFANIKRRNPASVLDNLG